MSRVHMTRIITGKMAKSAAFALPLSSTASPVSMR
jgi:hypothetical protein